MDGSSTAQFKREQPNSYAHPQYTTLNHMPPTETPVSHNYHQPPQPHATMPTHWNPTPSPYNEGGEHRPPPSDLPPHPQSYPHGYPPPPPHPQGPPSESPYSRHGSVSNPPTRSPPGQQQPPYTPHLNGNGPETSYYQQPPDYRGRPPYGPPEGQSSGGQPPPPPPQQQQQQQQQPPPPTQQPPHLHVTTNHEMMSGQPQSAPPMNPPYSAGPPPPHNAPPYGWGGNGGGGGVGFDPYRRKAVRAAQACDPCRQRKAKCDEGRPSCTHCKDNNLNCTYREVPPQKSEKQVLAITDKLETLSGNVDRMMERFQAQDDMMKCILKEIQSTRQGGSTSNHHDEENASSQQQLVTKLQRPASPERSQIWQRGEQSDPDPVSIPAESATAATATAPLFWPIIQNLLPREHNPSYVLDKESERGVLRLYGYGEGDDKDDGHQGAPSPATSSSSGRHDDDLRSSAPTGVWGTGQLPPATSANHGGGSLEHIGGLSPNGGLLLDSAIVDKYFASYLNDMHKLHPFLDVRVLKKMVRTFKERYSWDFKIAQRSISGTGIKRKRESSDSPGSVEDYTGPPMGRSQPRSSAMSHPPIEHSTSNAIILLVLALGKICAWKDPLPGTLAMNMIRTSATPVQGYSDLPMPSSASAPTSPYSVPSGLNGATGSQSGHHTSHGRNMDTTPGLAYFAKAADMIGEMAGACEVSHVQANLLAGLYMSQLARILASHHYIRNACTACQILIQSKDYREEKISPARRNLIKFAFWSCLQLESDIIAEINVSPSGIVAHEQAMWAHMPLTLTLQETEHQHDIKPSDRIVEEHRHYLYQIQLRRAINTALRYIYRDESKDNRDGGSGNSRPQKPSETWVAYAAAGLEGWRSIIHIPTDWTWSDDDHEAVDINMARMRAKYYGAKYIMHRPVLYWALHHAGEAPTPRSQPAESPMLATHHSDLSSPSAPYTFNASTSYRVGDMRPPPSKSYEPLPPWVVQACKNCVEAGIRSTTVFDKVQPRRLIITNIFGTAHAQFGNILSLTATYYSTHPQLRDLISRETLQLLMSRTIGFLREHEQISPTLAVDANILQQLQARVFGGPQHFIPTSASSSFSSR